MASRGRSKRVLILDDDPRWGRRMCRFLESYGYEVVAVTTPEDARLEQVMRPCDAAIFDVILPGPETGFEVARRFAHEWPGLKILIVSGDHGAQDAAGWHRRWPFLAKPFTPDDLLDHLHALLSGNGHARHA